MSLVLQFSSWSTQEDEYKRRSFKSSTGTAFGGMAEIAVITTTHNSRHIPLLQSLTYYLCPSGPGSPLNDPSSETPGQ
jgi:hypothetical protein